MNAAKQLKKEAKALGWYFHHKGGSHEIWKSPSGYKMPLPGTPKSNARTIQNIRAKLRRYL